MSLDGFKEPIRAAGKILDEKYTAYKMDSTADENNLRKTVELGTCKCCDYFLPSDDSVVLIEETQLLKTVRDIRAEFSYLDNEEKIDKIVNQKIADEMQLKTYGAMLVLCRLSTKLKSARELIKGKTYQFWLVASNIDTDDEKVYFDNQKDTLKEKLTGVIGKILLKDVKVWSAENLKTWFAKNAPTP